jgi:hypothetical protein
MQAASRNAQIGAELEDFFNSKFYTKAARAAEREVGRLLVGDTDAERAAGICLRRLSRSVRHKRTEANQVLRQVDDANTKLRQVKATYESTRRGSGVENVEPTK